MLFFVKMSIFNETKECIKDWLLIPKKVLFEPIKHIFDQNSHFLALNNPHWSKKWSFAAKTSL